MSVTRRRKSAPPFETIRVIFACGAEAVPAGGLVSGGLVLTTASQGAVSRRYRSIGEIQDALACEPCLVELRGWGDKWGGVSSLVDSRTRDFLYLTSPLQRAIQNDTGVLWTAHHCEYLAEAVLYHCGVLAERYAESCRQIAGFPPAMHLGESAGLTGQVKPYFEFDATISAMRQSYNAIGQLLWAHFRCKGTRPSSLEKILQKLEGVASPVLSRVRNSWVQVGRGVKAYRDCFQHYCPLDFAMCQGQMKVRNGASWTIRVLVPDNPDAKSKERFTYQKDIDALAYCRSLAEEVVDVMAAISSMWPPLKANA